MMMIHKFKLELDFLVSFCISLPGKAAQQTQILDDAQIQVSVNYLLVSFFLV